MIRKIIVAILIATMVVGCTCKITSIDVKTSGQVEAPIHVDKGGGDTLGAEGSLEGSIPLIKE